MWNSRPNPWLLAPCKPRLAVLPQMSVVVNKTRAFLTKQGCGGYANKGAEEVKVTMRGIVFVRACPALPRIALTVF